MLFSVSLLNGVLNARSRGRTKGCGMTVSASEEPSSGFNVERKRFMACLVVSFSYEFLSLGWVAISVLGSFNGSETSSLDLTAILYF